VNNKIKQHDIFFVKIVDCDRKWNRWWGRVSRLWGKTSKIWYHISRQTTTGKYHNFKKWNQAI